MKQILSFALLLLAVLSTVSCTDPKNQAIENLRLYYEELLTNSENYSSEEWESFMVDYAYNDSLINTFEYNEDELQEINDLRGRCSAYMIKGAANSVGKELDQALRGFGSFMDGLIDEFVND